MAEYNRTTRGVRAEFYGFKTGRGMGSDERKRCAIDKSEHVAEVSTSPD
jgi:hypothetical protein